MIAAATKLECFCLSPSETWVFAGNASGQIASISVDAFTAERTVQAHAGIVQAVACHPTEPYVAALSTDRHVSVWRYEGTGELYEVCRVGLRAIQPANEAEQTPFVHSTSQAIGFHDSKLRVVTRSANAGLLEFQFTPAGQITILGCSRLHGNADLITARYVVGGDAVLSGSVDGQLVLSERGRIVRRWQLGGSVVHWAEHVEGSTYLMASDGRFVARVDISREDDVHMGPAFTRDDLEHVSHNSSSGRTLVGSFDRVIHEIDSQSCAPIRVAFRAPFKCRWVTSLERSAHVAIVQCRNGGLYKVDIDGGVVMEELRSTPATLWTCVSNPSGALVLTGDGDRMLELRLARADPSSRVLRFDKSERSLGLGDASYTKRAVLDPVSGDIILARTSGVVYVVDLGGARVLADLRSAVRDIAVDGERRWLFAVCEDGSAHKLDLGTGEELACFRSEVDEPLWSLAYNPARGLLAIAERGGSLLALDVHDFTLRVKGIPTSRPKRMKWLDDDVLLYNYCDQIRTLNLRNGVRDVLVHDVGNTIEDFIWDSNREYLVFISYMQNLYLADLNTGDIINYVPDQLDYSKGLAWLSQPGNGEYPLDLMTFGRSGAAHYFRVHDEKLLALGPI